jgi:hypothetical protein
MATTQTPTNPVLPDFTRWQWASMDERAWWSPLFMEAANAFKEVERLSVLEGVREAAWQNVNTSELIEATQWAHYRGLLVVPTNTTGQAGSYSAQQSQGTDIVRIVYVRPENYAKVLPWVGDHHIGEMLGFPPCCRVAFRETWGKGQVDSTHEQFTNTTGLTYIHTLFRWMGIRTVPHMPCSHNCEQSIALEKSLQMVAQKYGYGEQFRLINEVQGWPVKWSRLFGIVELVSPALKITTRSDWTPTLQKFEKAGRYIKPIAGIWEENGYSNPETMREAHSTLLYSLKDSLPQNARVVDLGCGNGLLLKRLRMHRPDITIGGVDINKTAIEHAGLGRWKVGKIQECQWTTWKPDVVLVTPGRLTEMTPEDAELTRGALASVPQVFLYSYADTLTKGNLEHLATQAGFPHIQMLTKTPLVSVGLVTKD